MTKGYKGFDKDLKCRGFQYEINKEYEHEGEVKACNSGFHFCENPLDVFGYYPPSDSRYCGVESNGTESKDSDDSKVATSRIRLSAEIGIDGIIKAGVKFIFDKVKWEDSKDSNTGNQSAATNTGDRSAATNTGDRSAATNTGDQSAATNTGYQSAATNTGYQSAATNTGYQSAATVEGKQSVAMALGYQSKAKGAIGCWLVLGEKDEDYNLIDVQCRKVDGVEIKANAFYSLVSGEFKEAD